MSEEFPITDTKSFMRAIAVIAVDIVKQYREESGAKTTTDAPHNVMAAVSYLKGLRKLKERPHEAATIGFAMGFRAAEALMPVDEKGRCFDDVLLAFGKGGRPKLLTPGEEAWVVVEFAKLTDAGSTPYGAVTSIFRKINKQRDELGERRVSRQTIERVAGTNN